MRGLWEEPDRGTGYDGSVANGKVLIGIGLFRFEIMKLREQSDRTERVLRGLKLMVADYSNTQVRFAARVRGLERELAFLVQDEQETT